MSVKSLACLALASLVSAALVPRASVTCPDGKSVTANEKCCPLFAIRDDIQENLFRGGQCGEGAHSALRIAFHDAIGFSMSKDVGGGADGSIITFADKETEYAANRGTDEIVESQKEIMKKYDISAGDFIYLAAAIGLTNCPGAPRIPFLLGRPEAERPAEDGTVPEPFHDVSTILARFGDAGFDPAEVVALLASHSIAAADAVDSSVRGSPFDSTPGEFDTQFYIEMLLPGKSYPGNGPNKGEESAPIPGLMRLQSDYRFASDNSTACFWLRNIVEEGYMRKTFGEAMKKLSMLGQDIQYMTDCSDVIPMSKPPSGEPHLPAGTSLDQIDLYCSEYPFPNLTADPGPPAKVEPVKSDT